MVSDKIDNLTRMVDSLIQLNNSDKNLDDEAVDGYIKTVVAMSGAECSNEELAALKRNIQYKYHLYHRHIPVSKNLDASHVFDQHQLEVFFHMHVEYYDRIANYQ